VAKAGGGKRAAGIASVERRIVDFADADPWVKLLAYGRNGSGKTRLGGSGPEPFLIDVNDRGTKSIRNIPGKAFPADTWEDIVYAYWYLKSGKHKYGTLILDNLTMMQMVCIRQVLKEGADRDATKDPKMMSQPMWGKVAELMVPQLLDFRNLPMHVVFIAQERTVDVDDEETTEKVPDLSPKIRAGATGCVDIIARMQNRPFVRNKGTKDEKKEWHSVMFVGESDEYISKDRTYSLGEYMVDPTIPKIIDRMKGVGLEEKPKKKKSKKKEKK
jgi:hypothetical protein